MSKGIIDNKELVQIKRDEQIPVDASFYLKNEDGSFSAIYGLTSNSDWWLAQTFSYLYEGRLYKRRNKPWSNFTV